MVISVLKTEWMLFGELPRTLPVMKIGTAVIKLVKKYKFVGLIFTSVAGDIFAAHYSKKASKARAVANTTFAAKGMIGCLPPYEGIRLYTARMDPHLTFGCEVSLDVVTKHLEQLTGVQHQFLRRLLGLHSRSILAVLFSETGVVPLAYRRPIIALGYLVYLITLPATHYATAAYLDSKLPVPVQLSLGDLTAEGVASIRKNLEAVCHKWIGDTVTEMSSRLPLIQGRLDRNEDSVLVPIAAKLRQYLRIPMPAHRKAFTRLVLSAHTLSVEILRYDERHRKRTPREFRVCRFCRRSVETEAHALIACSSPALVTLRHAFLVDIFRMVPEMPRQWESAEDFLRAMVQSKDFDLLQRLAKYTYESGPDPAILDGLKTLRSEAGSTQLLSIIDESGPTIVEIKLSACATSTLAETAGIATGSSAFLSPRYRSAPRPIAEQVLDIGEQDYSVVYHAVVQNPYLHSILALVLALYRTPSSLQIAHLLDIRWETVLDSLLPVFQLLDPPAPPEYYHSDILLSDRMREVLVNPCYAATYVHLPKWHAYIAMWCLNRSDLKHDARDILYASDFWAHHVCKARASQELWDALRRSRLPCRLGSHAVLPWIITWLERVDTEDTRELMMLYRTTHRRATDAIAAGLRVEIMGGSMSMQFSG
ncbi:hypothetical protein B0H16DRAFT_1725506 [Mycena metata]|uniref:Uncharacterized protein n=1 Tax=Mycena metata TaxID=1033252 RepID=A0AAD7IR20_9AGAR|nr:hypothetical protein B0H16DRAFT_1725506 [Mycena metata]